MPIKFQIRGTQRDAYFASAFAAARVPRQADANYAVITDASAGIFGGKYLNATNNPQAVYVGLDNCPNTGRAITVLFRGIPTFTGLPPSAFTMFDMGNDAGGNLCGGISGAWGTDGKLFIYGAQQHVAANATFNAAFGVAGTFVTGQPVDLWFVWDGTTGANKAELWMAQNGNSPTLIATMTASRQNDLWDKFFMNWLSPWYSRANNAANPNRMHLNEFVVWDEVIVPTSFGARTDFIPTTAAAFEGYNYTDPGVANVRAATAYTFGGLAKTGTAVIVSLANTKTGVAGDGGTGTYDGSDRWTDPGVANVRAATAYKANSTSNNRTGTLDLATAANLKIGATQDNGAITGTYDGSDRWTDPGVANVRTGTAYKANSATNNRTGTAVIVTLANTKIGVAGDGGTGTYDGSDRWTDPGITHVEVGTAYKANSATNNRVGTLHVPVAAAAVTTKHGVTADDGVGTYRGADLWSDPGAAHVSRGTTYNADGVAEVGTLDSVTNVFSEATGEGADVHNATGTIEGIILT